MCNAERYRFETRFLETYNQISCNFPGGFSMIDPFASTADKLKHGIS